MSSKNKTFFIELILLVALFFTLKTILKDYQAAILTILTPIILKIIISKKTGYFWEKRDGTKLTLKQFLKEWKKGVTGITPLQQTKTSMMGIWITITGALSGMVINALVRMKDQWWWIEIVLFGSLILMVVNFIGTYQKYLTQKKVEETMRELSK